MLLIRRSDFGKFNFRPFHYFFQFLRNVIQLRPVISQSKLENFLGNGWPFLWTRALTFGADMAPFPSCVFCCLMLDGGGLCCSRLRKWSNLEFLVYLLYQALLYIKAGVLQKCISVFKRLRNFGTSTTTSAYVQQHCT